MAHELIIRSKAYLVEGPVQVPTAASEKNSKMTMSEKMDHKSTLLQQRNDKLRLKPLLRSERNYI